MIRGKFSVYDDETLKMLKRAVALRRSTSWVSERMKLISASKALNMTSAAQTLLASVLPTACISDEVSSRGNEPVKAGLGRWRKRSIELTAKNRP